MHGNTLLYMYLCTCGHGHARLTFLPFHTLASEEGTKQHHLTPRNHSTRVVGALCRPPKPPQTRLPGHRSHIRAPATPVVFESSADHPGRAAAPPCPPPTSALPRAST